MSEFRTVIPLNLEAVLKQLPPGSALHPRHGVRMTPDNNVEILWYNESLKTNASRAVDYSLDALAGKEPLPPEIIQPEKPNKAPTETTNDSGQENRVPNETVALKRKGKAQLQQ